MRKWWSSERHGNHEKIKGRALHTKSQRLQRHVEGGDAGRDHTSLDFKITVSFNFSTLRTMGGLSRGMAFYLFYILERSLWLLARDD